MQRFLPLLLLSLTFQFSFGQQSDFLFEHLTIDKGLPNNTVSAIARDHLGFMWFGTNDGLARYNGYEYTVYQHERENQTTLSNNKIYSILEDTNNNLWIATSSGLNLYNRDYDNFTRFIHEPDNVNSLSTNIIRTIYQDSSGFLWLGTLGGGLNKFDPATHTFTRYNFPSRNVSSILEDSEGNFWIGTGNPGIILFNWKSNDFTYYPFPQTSGFGLKPNTLKTIYEDAQGNLWVCTEGAGLYLFDKELMEFTEHYFYQENSKGISNNIVNDIFQINDETLWLATDGGGINLFDLNNREFSYIQNNVVDAKSLSTNAVYTFLYDEDEIIWIGTFGGGINILNPHQQEFRYFTQKAFEPHTLSHKSILAFCEDNQGNVWVGTDGGGLNLFDQEKRKFKTYSHEQGNFNSLSSNVVTSIIEDNKGNLWIGTFAGGLNRFDKNNGSFHRYLFNEDKVNSIGSNNVWKLMEDNENDIWVGTLDGLELYNQETNKFHKIPVNDNNGSQFPTRILSLFQDSNGNIWVGSTGVGILDKNTMEYTFINKHPEHRLKLSDYDIRDFHEDQQGNIWIASEGAGLFRYNPMNEELVNFTTRDGLPSDAIHQIVQDDSGVLWLSTNNGISRFDPQSHFFANYNVHDGLQSNQFAYSASLYSSKGEIFFGGVNGFNVFHPERIKKNAKPPQIYITDFTLFNKPVEIATDGSPLDVHISQTKEISLPYRSVFSFKFTAINYISTNKNQYRYKLEGFDDWNDVGDQRMATYTNIGPGKYVFRVIASNNDGIWNDEGTQIVINILPPFWRTWIAYSLYVIAFVALFYFIMNYTINRQKYKHHLMIKDLERAKIEEINQMKLRFFTNIAHEFRTPLTLILGPLDKIMSSHNNNADAVLKKQLNIMGRNAGRLLRLINELMEFRKIEMGRLKLKIVKADLVEFLFDVKSVFDEHARLHDIDFSFHSEVEVLEAWFDKEKMEKVVYNILSNSFKFTPDCGKISVTVKLKQKTVEAGNNVVAEHAEIVITDNGIGISNDDLPKIFDRFYQVRHKKLPNDSSVIVGTGIGLALSKELIEFHKGEILVNSTSGEGSSFCIIFPIDKKYFDQEILVEQTTNEYNYQYSPGLFGIPHAELKQHADPPLQNNSENKPVLLFVDDNPDMRSYIVSSLETFYHVYEATNGLEGLEKAKQLLPDIIVSDVMMPEMNGIEMCEKIKNDMNTSHIPIILLTAKTSDDFTIEGFDAGADDYIPKPFNPKVLHSRIKNILEIRQQLRDCFRKEGILQPSDVSVTSADELFLKKAMGVVEENIGNPEFRVSTFVSKMAMSRSVLYRKFESLTGQSVNEFVRNTRLKRAAQLLSLNELTVSEITYEVGFSDPQYFSKCFSKYYNMTPSEYARKNLNKSAD